MNPFPLLCSLVLGLGLIAPVRAQLSVIPCNVPGVQFGAVDAADYNGDGRPDLLVTGLDATGNPLTRILRYVRRNVVQIPMGGIQSAAVYADVPFVNRSVYRGSAQWGDYDGDGDPDFIITGLTIENVTTDSLREVPSTTVYFTDGTTFFPDGSLLLPGLFDSDTDWGDYDGDGNLDLVLAGNTGTSRIARIYRNTGGGRLVDTGAVLTGIAQADVEWGDMDGDGDLDLALTGLTDEEEPVAMIYRNDGDDRFVAVPAGLPPPFFGNVRWGDFDGDGDDDLLLSGGRLDPNLFLGVTRIFRNDGGAFVDAGVALPGTFYGDATWTDFDGDGDLDVMMMGLRNLGSLDREVALVYRNEGGAFTPAYQLRGAHFGAALLYDYDGDARTDLFYTGLQINVTNGRLAQQLVVNLWEQTPPVVDPESVVSLANACN